MTAPPWVIVARREYLQRIRSTGFRVATLLGPLMAITLVAVPTWLIPTSSVSPRTIAIQDSTHALQGSPDEAPWMKSQPFQLWDAPLDIGRSVFVGLVEDQALDAAILISADGRHVEFVAGSQVGRDQENALRRLVYREMIRQRIAGTGLTQEVIDSALAAPSWKITLVRPARDPRQAAGLAMFMALLLYAMLLTYGMATMRSVVEEKSSRIVEMLLSSLRPGDILAGKICGLGAVGLTQYAVWFLLAGALLSVPMGSAHSPSLARSALRLPPGVALACVSYFILGYALFAGLYATIAGMVSSTDDAHQVHLPVTGLLIAPILMVWLVIAAPDSPVARVLSLIPPFTPVLMLPRMVVGSVPAREIALSMALLAAAIAGSLAVAARVFRAGILLQGKSATPREVWRWIREQ